MFAVEKGALYFRGDLSWVVIPISRHQSEDERLIFWTCWTGRLVRDRFKGGVPVGFQFGMSTLREELFRNKTYKKISSCDPGWTIGPGSARMLLNYTKIKAPAHF